MTVAREGEDLARVMRFRRIAWCYSRWLLATFVAILSGALSNKGAVFAWDDTAAVQATTADNAVHTLLDAADLSTSAVGLDGGSASLLRIGLDLAASQLCAQAGLGRSGVELVQADRDNCYWSQPLGLAPSGASSLSGATTSNTGSDRSLYFFAISRNDAISSFRVRLNTTPEFLSQDLAEALSVATGILSRRGWKIPINEPISQWTPAVESLGDGEGQIRLLKEEGSVPRFDITVLFAPPLSQDRGDDVVRRCDPGVGCHFELLDVPLE